MMDGEGRQPVAWSIRGRILVGLTVIGLSTAVVAPAGTAAASGGRAPRIAGHGKAPAPRAHGRSAHGDDPAAAEGWFVKQRMTPGVTDPATYAAAEQAAVSQAARAHTQSRASVAGASNPIWQQLGPAPLENPDPSFISSITIPAQANSGRVMSVSIIGSGSSEQAFIGSAGGGVWSGDVGSNPVSWDPRTDFQQSLSSGAVAVAPSNNQVVYAGTGEDDQGADSFYGQGILVSTNGGANWTDDDPANVLAAQAVSAIAVDPADPAHIYAGTTAGFFSSTDSAYQLLTPTSITYPSGQPPNVTAVVVDPTNFSTVYIAVPGVGIEKSTDGGTTFSVLTVGSLAGSSFSNVAMAISADGTTLYTEIYNGSSTSVYKSSNSGSTWANTGAPVVTNPEYYYGAPAGTDQGFYDLAMAVDPLNANVVYLAGIGISVSTNGGSTWSGSGNACLNQAAACSLGDYGIHPDFHSLVFDSSGNLYLGNDGGIYELPATFASAGTAGTDGADYVDLNANLATLQLYPGGTQTGDAATVLAGSQDNGTGLYSGASTWTEVNGGDGGFTSVDQGNTQVQLSTADGQLVATTDGWSTSSVTSQPAVVSENFVPPIAVVNSSATLGGLTVLYGGERPYKSTNGGSTWTRLTNSYVPSSPAEDGNDVSALAVAPSNSSVIYCGWGDGTLQVSTNGGTNWTTITPSAFETSSDFWITHIAVDPANPAHIAVTFSGFTFPQYAQTQPHVVETTNATAATPTWTDDTGAGLPGAPTNSAVFDGSTLIVATDVGVYSAIPAGTSTSWAPLGANLPLVQVEDLSLSADSSTLVAFTHGRGAWTLALPTTGHELIVSQLRFSGPGGPTDAYVDLYNTSPSAMSLNGWTLHYETSTGSDASISLPAAASIPPHGYYLVAGTGYSLASFAAADDSTSAFAPPLSATGVELVAPNSTVSDAVGLSTASSAYRQGSGLPDSSVVSGTTADYAFARAESSGNLADTGDNAADFLLLVPDGPATLTGAAWGAPDPQDLASLVERNDLAYSTLLDPTVSANAAPNQSYDSTTGILTVDRTITNDSTTQTITQMDLRISTMSVQGGPGSNPHAWLQVQTSPGGSPSTSCCGTLTVEPITLLQPPTQADGGGIDSVLSVPLPSGGLTPGTSVNVQFTFKVAQTGGYWFGYDVLLSV